MQLQLEVLLQKTGRHYSNILQCPLLLFNLADLKAHCFNHANRYIGFVQKEIF